MLQTLESKGKPKRGITKEDQLHFNQISNLQHFHQKQFDDRAVVCGEFVVDNRSK